MSFLIGVDLGQKQDFSAMVIAEVPWILKPNHRNLRIEPMVYLSQLDRNELRQLMRDGYYRPAGMRELTTKLNIVHVERWLRGTPYPTIVDDVVRFYEAMTADGLARAVVIVDATGVGRPVVDLFRERRLQPFAVTITGGTTESQNGFEYTVPKRDLVMSAVRLLETDRLRWPAKNENVRIMENELRNFQMTYSKAGNELFEAERKEHDDLVLALAMTCWGALNLPFRSTLWKSYGDTGVRVGYDDGSTEFIEYKNRNRRR